MKKFFLRIVEWFSYLILITFGVVAVYYLVRIVAFDSFPVNTTSMTPTIRPGDRILVNKLIFGGRIYKSFDFSDGARLESWRMLRWRKIRHNDIVVFNYVRGEDSRRMSFNFSTVYVKRCIGLSGDTLSILGGFFDNPASDMPLGLEETQRQLAEVDTSKLLGQFPALRFARPHPWTILNLGPLYVPEKGGTIPLTPLNYRLYKRLIEYETRGALTEEQGVVRLDGMPVSEYTFRQNYYFMCGDHLVNSIDSRSWGFVPEDFIIGVTRRTLTAHTPDGKMNWRRVLKRF